MAIIPSSLPKSCMGDCVKLFKKNTQYLIILCLYVADSYRSKASLFEGMPAGRIQGFLASNPSRKNFQFVRVS